MARPVDGATAERRINEHGQPSPSRAASNAPDGRDRPVDTGADREKLETLAAAIGNRAFTTIARRSDAGALELAVPTEPGAFARGLEAMATVPGDGMLFDFGRPTRTAFTMARTTIPLDLVTLDERDQVKDVTQMVPGESEIQPAQAFTRAIELRRGDAGYFGLRPGAQLTRASVARQPMGEPDTERVRRHDGLTPVAPAQPPTATVPGTTIVPQPEELQPASAGPNLPALSHDERNELTGETRLRMSLAYTAYVSACHHAGHRLENAAHAEVEFFNRLVDTFLGPLAPFLSTSVARLAERLPIEASALAYRVALAALDTDRTKRIFTSAVSAGGRRIKSEYRSIQRESDGDAFLVALEGPTKGAFRK